MSIGVQRGQSLVADGLKGTKARWNLPSPALYEEAVRRGEGLIAAHGPLVCRTGQHTGRSPNDKFIVREAASERNVAWGGVNRRRPR
jgi:ATP-dependent phosphoenolpyruvate carboxykinase